MRVKIRASGFLLVGLAALTIGLFSAMPAANAATYTYANKITLQSGQEYSSGLRSSITGGVAEVHAGLGQSWITTYRPAPGYTEIARSTAQVGNVINLVHARAYNVHSKCGWYISGGGELKATCSLKW